jgi:ribonuclease P protein component
MLAATHRLRRRSDFAATIRGGRRAARGALVVHVDFQPPARAEPAVPPAPPRAGFVVSKAVGGAVQRNRVKRRLRHLVRARIDTLPSGAMLVVRALPAAAERSYDELGADLDGAIARATTGRRR